MRTSFITLEMITGSFTLFLLLHLFCFNLKIRPQNKLLGINDYFKNPLFSLYLFYSYPLMLYNTIKSLSLRKLIKKNGDLKEETAIVTSKIFDNNSINTLNDHVFYLNPDYIKKHLFLNKNDIIEILSAKNNTFIVKK